jgi:hypothetical protein
VVVVLRRVGDWMVVVLWDHRHHEAVEDDNRSRSRRLKRELERDHEEDD